MATIVKLPRQQDVAATWMAVAQEASRWLATQRVAVQDAVLLLPFEQLLAPARRAWAKQGGWMPRIETTQTLARSLQPPVAADELQLTFDPALDRLIARRLLRPRPWAIEWSRRDPAGFDEAIDLLVQAAHEFSRLAATVSPSSRAQHWAAAREALGVRTGPGESERLLARVALEWAATAAAPDTDVLFELTPSAWLAVEAGGPNALVASLLAASPDTPALTLDVDASPDDPFDGIDSDALRVAVCSAFEDEARRAAAEVLHHLRAGRQPIALVAQDRLLVRRVRALLSRQEVPLADETGWKLSTTRAGATVMALLRAAHAEASTDEALDWIKASVHAWPHVSGPVSSLELLEAALRRGATARVAAVDAGALAPRAAALWGSAMDVVTALQPRRGRPLLEWLQALREALDGCGAWGLLGADEAGRQAMAALYLIDETRVLQSASTDAMSFGDFTRWVDDALESASYRPPVLPGVAVVVTPLERVMLRPFAAVVFPGCDAKRLGAASPPHPLLDEATAVAIGLPGAAARRDAELLAFAQLLRLPHVSLLRRLDDDGEPLAASPLLTRLELVHRARSSQQAGAGAALPAMSVDPARRAVAPAPVPRPLPGAAALLPSMLTASACEALRACPYRFFAQQLLRLREADELDDAVEKRDYGTWLHAVLHRFHATREAPLPPDAEIARLHRTAGELQAEQHLDDADFMPFAATFLRLAPHYVEWLHGRDADGAQWRAAEVDLVAEPAAWGGIGMKGRIDRIDALPGTVTQLIDYKTGSAQSLRDLVKQPQEDTQLAFYAALMSAQAEAAAGDAALAAAYLPLDSGDELKTIEHPDVADTARLLVEGIGHDLHRLRDGAPLPALGEGRSCDYCEARGLCRRDHWAAQT